MVNVDPVVSMESLCDRYGVGVDPKTGLFTAVKEKPANRLVANLIENPQFEQIPWAGLATVPPPPQMQGRVVAMDPATPESISYFDVETTGFPYDIPKTIYKKQKIHRDAIGRIDDIVHDQHGLQVNFTLNDQFTQGVISAREALNLLGFKIENNKENDMPNTFARTLQTPAKNIKRKDLTVAMRLAGMTNKEDFLFDIVALVQSVGEGEKVYRANELKAEDAVGKYIRVHSSGATGGCSDFVPDANREWVVKVVLDGKLYELNHEDFLIVSDLKPTEPYDSMVDVVTPS